MYSSTFDSNTILDPPPVELLLYSHDMVQELIDGLGEENEEVLLMEKAKPTGKPAAKPTGKPVAPKKKDEKEKEPESKN